ncbi:MAG: hypothetical protein WBP41_15510 [Saprospiraceae bacterium]
MNTFSNIPKSIIEVVNPDHPYTFDGPDVLLSDRNGLLAIFEIRETDQQSANKLFSRVINSILAYPPSTKMCLLLDNSIKYPSAINQLGSFYFDEFIEYKDIRYTKSIIKNKKQHKKVKEIANIQKKLFSIQSQILTNNLDYIKNNIFNSIIILQTPFLTEKAKSFNRETQKEIITKANIFQYNDRIYGMKKLSGSSSDLKELQPYYEFVINSEFFIDTGIPYYNNLKKKVLNLTEVPKQKNDPIKPLRIASLFGWLLVNSNDFNQLESRIPKPKLS